MLHTSSFISHFYVEITCFQSHFVFIAVRFRNKYVIKFTFLVALLFPPFFFSYTFSFLLLFCVISVAVSQLPLFFLHRCQLPSLKVS